jgi:hypothetical protein
MHAHRAGPPPLDAGEELVLPLHQRVVTQYATGEAGARELRLYYADKEISFDEPEYFAFGETLARQSRFVAGSAAQWGEGYEWQAVRGLLEELLQTGVLRRARDLPADAPRGDGARPSPLPPAPSQVARTWAECEEITRELTGRSLEVGYLELVVPVFRVAHMALDADGRQVGEANVFPPALRVEVPTRWRTCIYSGTRFQQERPMNVSALKTMRAHWPQMMALLRRIRAAYLHRFPAARAGWTVGHLERLATVVLALPSYMLMREQGRVANGELHPALACLFRVTDGLRMVMHQMLFIPIGEPAWKADAPLTAAQVLTYAERNYSFHSERGVCAGPQAMMDEFLATIMDGQGSDDGSFDPAVQEALDQLQPAMDYGLLGLKAHAALFSTWPLMTRAYEDLVRLAEAGAAHSASASALALRLSARLDRIRAAAFLAREEWRVDREAVYADMYAQSHFGVTGSLPERGLGECLAGVETAAHAASRQAVRRAVARCFGTDAAHCAPEMRQFTDRIVAYLVQAQQVLRVACEAQREVNALLGRAQPRRKFTATDVDLHHRLRGEHDQRLPNLVQELEDILGLRISVHEDEVAAVPAR